MSPVARVAVEKTTCRFDKLFDYAIPEGMALTAGVRVMVPFGRGGRRVGLVVALADVPESDTPLKPVAAVLEEEPVLTEEGLFLLRWLRENTFCTWFDALSVLIPAGYGLRGLIGWSLVRGVPLPEALSPTEQQVLSALKPRRKAVAAAELAEALGLTLDALPLERLEALGLLRREEVVERRIGDKTLQMVRLSGTEPERLTPKQRQVYELLEQVGCGSIREICYFAGVTRGVVEKLVQQGIAEAYEQEVLRTPVSRETVLPEPPPALTEEQTAAVETLWQGFAEGGRTGLLYGVTGSGKTAVYLTLAHRILAEGRRCIVLVPEISLTPQTIRRFLAAFGRRVAVMHSALSLSERLDEYKRIRRGEVDVVVGTRSAVFAPVEKLGLIIVDEEQEHTYRSEKAPRYDAGEIARLRARRHGGLCVLASATPSIETAYRAEKGEYLLAKLTHRYGGAPLPDVTILDLRERAMAAEALSEELCEELMQNLDRGEQSILFVNRRGYSATATCMSCHQPLECPHCSISLKFHAANGRLMCHYCGYSTEVPKACPHCGSRLMRYSGVGTQKVEEALKLRFPQARILRMDQDTTSQKNAHERKLAAFARQEYDIMLGTQMVAKGLDFEKVTLVGVVAPDQMLYADDFRSYEHTFSLITQVVGRGGRRELPGRAFLQTYQPDHPVLTAAARQDYPAFYKTEVETRRLLLYPPFCRLYCLGFWGENEAEVKAAGQAVLALLERLLPGEYPELPVRLLGLAPANVLRVAGRYRYKLIIKGKNSPRMRELLWRLYTEPELAAVMRNVTLTIDPNYDSDL